MDGGYRYNGKFEGKILIVGQTGYGKTTFIQKLAKKNVWIPKGNILDHKNFPSCTKRKQHFFLLSIKERDMQIMILML